MKLILWNNFYLIHLPDNLKLNEIDAEDPEISDYNMIPDTSRLSEAVRVCLQESDEIPADYTRLFEQRLFSISTQLVPSAIRAYDQLGVKHEQLRLISPQFETPLPPLAAAVFPPSFKELSNPQVSEYCYIRLMCIYVLSNIFFHYSWNYLIWMKLSVQKSPDWHR